MVLYVSHPIFLYPMGGRDDMNIRLNTDCREFSLGTAVFTPIENQDPSGISCSLLQGNRRLGGGKMPLKGERIPVNQDQCGLGGESSGI